MKCVKKAGLYISALSLILLIPPGCYSNRQGTWEEATGSGIIENCDISLYLLYVPSGQDEASRYTHKKRFESSHIPQAAAAFFPARFVYSPGNWVWSSQANISWQITEERDLKSNLREYNIRVSGSSLAPGPGRRYQVTFSLADLDAASPIRQPAIYALEQGTIRAALDSGCAWLESITYNPTRRTFKAEVIIAPTR
jgi:hypothetical protein